MKKLIISLCFSIIDKLIDEDHIVKLDSETEELIEELIDGVIIGQYCHCPQGSLCEFFNLEEDGDARCLYGGI